MKTIRPAAHRRRFQRSSITTSTVALASSLCVLFWQNQALAQAAPATSLREVTVTSGAENETATSAVIGYRAKNAATATKTDTPLHETPQSVTVVTRDQIVDQGATNLQDALNYAAGVRSDAYGLDSRSDGVRVRGSYPDVYLDGLRQAYGYYTSSIRTDPYTLERLEVLRGPSGMLFGQGSTAGVVNMVSKRPQAERQGEIGVQLGSYGRKQVQADLTGPLNADGSWLYRLVALQRQADTQVDYVRDDRALFAPTLTWKPNTMTSLTLQAMWQKDKTGTAAQFFPWSGTVLANPNGALPSHRFIGETDDYYDTERQSIGWLLEHRFNDNWSLRQNLRLSKNVNDARYHYADAFGSAGTGIPGTFDVDPVNQRLLGRILDSSRTSTRMALADQHLEGRFATGAVQHQLLIGFDVNRQTENVAQSPLDASAYSVIDAYDPVYTSAANLARIAQPRTTQRHAGLYLQDQLKIDNWIVVAGLRHDRVTSTQEGASDEDSRATTMRLGLMYQLANGWAPYLSYSESFTPVGGTDFYGGRFKPLEGEQTEAGIKYQPAGGNTVFTASVYKLKEKNQRINDPGNAANQLQAGATKNSGLELEYKATLARALDLIANYNYTKVDKALEGLPKHNLTVWSKYRFAPGPAGGFSIGAGVRYVNAFRDGTAPEVPAVTLLDLMASYDTQHWRYALNVNNATDKSYFSTCLSRGDCWFGSRRSVVASATYRF